MTLALIALFVSGTIVALFLMRYEQLPLTVGRMARLVLCVVALGLLSAVGRSDPLPISVMYPIATGVAAVMLAGALIMERKAERR